MGFILIIDDNKQTTDALLQMLKLWDLQARAALSPAIALSILEVEIPRIIFLDINMPGVNGFEILTYLHGVPRLAKIPVIIVTSDDQPQTAKRAFDLGAAGVINKPVMVDVLEKCLKKMDVI